MISPAIFNFNAGAVVEAGPQGPAMVQGATWDWSFTWSITNPTTNVETIDDVNIILSALGELQAKHSMHLITLVQSQVQEQLDYPAVTIEGFEAALTTKSPDVRAAYVDEEIGRT